MEIISESLKLVQSSAIVEFMKALTKK